jgi:hypothetical protein
MQCACAILSSVRTYNIFPTLFHKGHDFLEKNYWTLRVWVFCTTFVWSISHSKKTWARCEQNCMLVCYRQNFGKYSNNKRHENLSSGSRVVACGPMDRRTDMTMLIVAFQNYENSPKNYFEIRYKKGSRFSKLWELTQKITLKYSTKKVVAFQNYENSPKNYFEIQHKKRSLVKATPPPLSPFLLTKLK